MLQCRTLPAFNDVRFNILLGLQSSDLKSQQGVAMDEPVTVASNNAKDETVQEGGLAGTVLLPLRSLLGLNRSKKSSMLSTVSIQLTTKDSIEAFV